MLAVDQDVRKIYFIHKNNKLWKFLQWRIQRVCMIPRGERFQKRVVIKALILLSSCYFAGPLNPPLIFQKLDFRIKICI